MKKVLIAFASKSGSTKEVAESIAERIQTETVEVDVKNIDSIPNVSEYDMVVVGAPINGMKWRQDAVDFVGIHQSDLMYKRTAYFSLSYTAVLGRKMWRKQISKAFDNVSKQVPPIKTGTFAGKVDGEMPAVVRFIFGMPKDTPHDQRDWDLISTWAEDLSHEIGKL